MIFYLFIGRRVNRFLVLHISLRYTIQFQIILHWNNQHSRFIKFSCHLYLMYALAILITNEKLMITNWYVDFIHM
jgi:hypothetical protein